MRRRWTWIPWSLLLAFLYAGVTRPGALPGAVAAAWWAAWTWYPTLTLVLVFTPLLFPTGRLPSPRWRLVAWPGAAGTVAMARLAALTPTLELGGTGHLVANPIGLAGVENPEHTRVGSILFGLLIVLVLAAFASMVVRFRRSRGDERQQLKWITFAAALGGVYAGLVLGLGQLFGRLGARTPSWVVAASTLAVAALFQPARRRIQQTVDRRFNRRRHDAARTVEGFATRLRDQVDLDTLSAELLAVVDQTVQPTAAALLLRPAAGTTGRPQPAAPRPG